MCGQVGVHVPSETVTSIVNESCESYYMLACLNPECQTLYFERSYYPLYFYDFLDLEIGFKNSDDPIVCYCHSIRESHIKFKVDQGARYVKDILGSSKVIIGQCKTKHPLGCDCTKNIRRIMNDYLRDQQLL